MKIGRNHARMVQNNICSEGIRMINGIKTQTVEIPGTQQIFSELHIIKIWSSKKLMFNNNYSN